MSHATSKSLRPEAAGPRLYCEIDGLEVDVDVGSLTAAGLFVQSIDPIADDSEIELFLRSALGSASVQATVVRVVSCDEATRQKGTPGFGVLFMDLADETRRFLEDTVRDLRQHRTLMPPAAATAPAVAQVPPAQPASREQSSSQRVPRAKRTTTRNSNPPPARGLAPPKPALRPANQPGPRAARPPRDVTAIRRELQQALEQERQWAAWRVLGIDATASPQEAKRAFLRKAKERHPHAYARHDCQEIKQLATELFILCKQAYSEFCREADRRGRAPDRGAEVKPKPRRRPPTRSYQQD